jgi:predicted RNase H-like nuclease
VAINLAERLKLVILNRGPILQWSTRVLETERRIAKSDAQIEIRLCEAELASNTLTPYQRIERISLRGALIENQRLAAFEAAKEEFDALQEALAA